MKLIIVVALALLVAVANGKPFCAGCPETIDNQEAAGILKTTLAKLATLDGPYYTLSTIHSATVQVVAGVLYKIDVDLIGTDNHVERCDVKIVQQAWLGTSQVTFDCPNKPEVVKAYTD